MDTRQSTRGSNLTAGPADPQHQLSPSCWEFIINTPEKSSLEKGTTFHRVIREQLSAHFLPRYGPRISVRLPDASFDPYRFKSGIKGGGKRQGEGDFDLAFKDPGGTAMLVAEVKPANWEGMLGGGIQLENYINKANSNEDLKKRHGVKDFSPMLPDRFDLLPPIFALAKEYEIRWCAPGLLLYKEVRKGEDEEKKDKKGKQQASKKEAQQSYQSYKEQVKEQRSTSAKDRGTSAPMQLKILRAAPRSEPLPNWVPQRLRRDIAAGTIADGLYRDRYSATWPLGYSTNVVVWAKTSFLGREVQFYQEFPEDPSFYEKFARKRGLSVWQANLIRKTMTEYNRDLWSLIAPPSSRSPFSAREELRTIYGGILKGVFEASGLIVGVGAGITSLGNAMRQRGTTQTGIPTNPKVATPGEPPLPDWVYENVQKGADLFRNVEKQMRVTVTP